MFSAGRALSIFLLLLLMSGCTRSLYSIRQDSLYSASEYRYAAGNKDLATRIYGNLSTGDETVFRHRVLSAMQAVNNGLDAPLVARTRFVEATTDEGAYRVIVLVNPEHSVSGASLCSSDFLPRHEPTPTALSARMSLCRDQALLSSVYGELSEPVDAAAPQFDGLITRMTQVLFSQQPEPRAIGGSLLLSY